MADKQAIIADVFKKSMDVDDNKSLYRKAREKDLSIEWKDILEFKRRKQKQGYKGYNSYIANLPREQYHIDVAYIQGMMKDIMQEKDRGNWQQIQDLAFPFCFICMDVFSKRVFTRAQKANNQAEAKESMAKAFNDMGVPKQIYTDRGTEFQGMSEFLKENGIDHIQTRTHAVFAERFIRFMKGRLDEKIDNVEDALRWFIWLNELTKYYNNHVHDTTKLTPKEAEKDENAMTVKANIVLKSKQMRRYPPLRVGDEVKIYKKPAKRQFENSYNNKWVGPTKVNRISYSNNLTYYHVDDDAKPMLRHELLKL